jgi:hypothetical protein
VVDSAWCQDVVDQRLVVIDSGKFYPGSDLTIGALFLPSGIVRLYFPLFHVNDTLSANVVHIILSNCLFCLNISQTACCGLSSLMSNSGTGYIPGMSNLCGLPLSS